MCCIQHEVRSRPDHLMPRGRNAAQNNARWMPGPKWHGCRGCWLPTGRFWWCWVGGPCGWVCFAVGVRHTRVCVVCVRVAERRVGVCVCVRSLCVCVFVCVCVCVCV